MLERELESQVGNYCKAHGLWFRKWVCPGVRGVPDRIIFGPCGKIMFMEFKKLGKSPRPNQKIEIARLRRLGFQAHIVDRYDVAVSLLYTHFLKAQEQALELI